MGDMSKSQFQANHASMLQQKHDSTIKNIQELQELEKYMFQNLQNINKSDATSGQQAVVIQKRIEELSAMRESLFTKLKNLYTNVQSNAADNRGDLADQIAVVEIVEKELAIAKRNLNKLIAEKNNKHRMVQIGEYETAQYTSHKNILKVFVYGIVVLILVTYLMAFSWFPRNAGVVLIILTITVTLGLTAKSILENYGRDNLVWSQFNQGTDANQLSDALKNGGGLSVWDYNKRSMEKAYDSAKSEASSALTAVADGSAKSELESKFKNELNTIQATTTGQVQASDSQTKEGFAPF